MILQIINSYDVHIEIFPAFSSFHYTNNRLLIHKKNKNFQIKCRKYIYLTLLHKNKTIIKLKFYFLNS